MLNFQDLPDELVLKILSYVSGFNPIPTGNGLNQSIHVTQAGRNRVNISVKIISGVNSIHVFMAPMNT